MRAQTIQTIVAFVLLVIFAVVMLVPRREHFQTAMGGGAPSSRDLFRNNRGYQNEFITMQQVRSDRNDIFLTHSCIHIPREDAIQTLNTTLNAQPFLTRKFQIVTQSFQDVEARIVQEVEAVFQQNSRKPLQGPVYAILMQAPYYFDESGQLISIQFNADSGYNLQPYNTMTPEKTYPNIFLHVWLCFAAHDKANPLRTVSLPDAVARMQWMAPYRSHHSKCFMSCIGSNNAYPTYCGCVTVKQGANGSPYDAKCLGPTTDFKHNGQLSGFGMVYALNDLYAPFFKKQMLATPLDDKATFLNDSWKCVAGVNTPIMVNPRGDVMCMSKNGKDCMTEKSRDKCERLAARPPANLAPLACGEDHKKKWGSTGYDTKGHWCDTASLRLWVN